MNSSDCCLRRRSGRRVSYPDTCGPLESLVVDPDPELQVRHRRLRGRAMVCETLHARAPKTRAIQLEAMAPCANPESGELPRKAQFTSTEDRLRQVQAEPTKMRRPSE
jgi:hypothetical protein